MKIAFLDGERNLRERVERVASEWTRYANLRFDFVDKVADADIRVSFRKPGSWSFVGTEALRVAKDQPTINFGWLTSATEEDEVRRVVLHEFGHVLGLIEEMNNPNNDIKWNTDVVYKVLAGPPNNWPKSQVDDVLLNKSRREDYPNYRSFDPNSIMMFPIAASWTLNGLTIGLNAVLSESDKAFVSQLYPR